MPRSSRTTSRVRRAGVSLCASRISTWAAAARTFERAIFADLEWLGLTWDAPPVRQSERMDAYAAALARLEEMGLVYPCFCTRAEIAAEIARAGEAPQGEGSSALPWNLPSPVPWRA